MKISYKTHPILESLSTKKWRLRSDEKIDTARLNAISNNVELFAREIIAPSIPFVLAAGKEQARLLGLYSDMIEQNEDMRLSGTYIISGLVYFVSYINKNEYSLLITTNDGIIVSLLSSSQEGGYYSFNNSSSPAPRFGHNSLFALIIIEMFKKFAAVETKLIQPGQRVRALYDNHVNDTKLPILHLDSKWFTTIVKSEGFNVRGHFRLQPYGEGLKERKLIWVEEFKKTGYTSPARKLTNTTK